MALLCTDEVAVEGYNLVPAVERSLDALGNTVGVNLIELFVADLLEELFIVHIELVVLVLEVYYPVLEQIFHHVLPVGVGMAAGNVEVSLHTAALNVDGDGLEVGKLLAGVGDGVMDK